MLFIIAGLYKLAKRLLSTFLGNNPMLWLKAFHIIFMVTWFAGLFYLPRLYVYHAMSEDEVSQARFKVMERKLYYGIMAPGAVLTLLFGFAMLYYYHPNAAWLHWKLFLVALLCVYHGMCGKYRKDFLYNRNRHTHVFYRYFNEIPVFFLLAIVLLVVLKPELAI